MSKEEIVVGLDIGTTKVCVIVGRKNEHGKIEVMGIGRAESDGVTRGVVTNIQKTVDAIKLAVDRASSTSNVAIKVVHVGIAGQHIKSIPHKGMIVRPRQDDEIGFTDVERLVLESHKLVMQPGEEIIHVIPQEFSVDNGNSTKDPVGMAGTKLEGNFHIITALTTAVKNIHKCVERAGLSIESLILEPLASAEAVLTEEEKEAGVCLVDIGGGTTDVAIFHDGIIRHTAVIPLGGNIVTEDIREGCTVMRKQAEALKTKFGSALADATSENEIISIPGLIGREPKEISMKNLAFIIQARMEEIFDHIRYEIMCSGFEKKLVGGIVVTGGGSMLKNMRQFVEYYTTMNARIGNPNGHLAKVTLDEVKSPIYSTSVGLVMKGFTVSNEIFNQKKRESTSNDVAVKGRGWFPSLFEKAKDYLSDDMNDFEK